MATPGRAKDASGSKRGARRPNVTTISPEDEPGPLANLWKEAFPVGTEWVQYDRVYELPWKFESLEKAFDDGGVLHGKKVYLFGCTEPQLCWMKYEDGTDYSRVVQVPAVVAVPSQNPPSEKVGIKSVQMGDGEKIVPMKEMKMDWIPYMPEDVGGHVSLERYRTQIFTLKCTQRKAALKQLNIERIKKYEYCLPHLERPSIDGDEEDNTIVDIMYPFEDESKPPLLCDFDWQFDDAEEIAENFVQAEELPKEEKEKFMAFVSAQVLDAKKKLRASKAERKKVWNEMSNEKKDFLKNMQLFKFYPTASPETPDISAVKVSFINRYYGKATQVL